MRPTPPTSPPKPHTMPNGNFDNDPLTFTVTEVEHILNVLTCLTTANK